MPELDINDPELTARLADVDYFTAKLNDATAALRDYLAACRAPPHAARPQDDGWPMDAGHPDLVSPIEAARRVAHDDDTIRRWAAAHGIGRQYRKRWRISLRRLNAFMADPARKM
ncbi:hypothetical protein [Methylobacterium crusticola]|uniref:hypothetical protein n=1 Tax=Methylobacterium crusticola TaxID=1697972 RepID=UPI000FFC48F6|nr:hypothetical protein [Methylobacterium crusticola]